MKPVSEHEIRLFRLHRHRLDARPDTVDVLEAAGACGLQNSPPGAWETALFNRAPGCSLEDMDRLLYQDKTLLQAWSLRGAPYVFPAAQSGAFLSSLIPRDGEEWVYTKGIGPALCFLGMGLHELLEGLVSVIPVLDQQTVRGKAALDSLLAGAMIPLIPALKRGLWNSPSMYGRPEAQTVGGAAVSFLLRPCALMGLVVFAHREGQSPCFTSFKSWTGREMKRRADSSAALVRMYLRSFGPAEPGGFAAWLGCSGEQARRMWAEAEDRMIPVSAGGRTAFILAEDKPLLSDPPAPRRDWLLLGPHDPYLDQRDREVILPEKALQRKLWRTAANPGAVIFRGEVCGVWTARIRAKGLEAEAELWKTPPGARDRIGELAEGYAAFRQQKLIGLRLMQ